MRHDLFTTIRSEGALLPPDFLMRIAEGDKPARDVGSHDDGRPDAVQGEIGIAEELKPLPVGEATLAGWRIVPENQAARAFDGEGARVYGGRWNSIGVAKGSPTPSSICKAASS